MPKNIVDKKINITSNVCLNSIFRSYSSIFLTFFNKQTQNQDGWEVTMLLYQKHVRGSPTTFDMAEKYWKLNIIGYILWGKCEKINSDLKPGKNTILLNYFS